MAIDGAILTSWLITVGLVVLHEGLGGVAFRAQQSMPAPLDVREQWFGLYYQDQKVGFANVILVAEEREGVPGLSIIDHGRLRFSLLGVPQQLEIRTRAFIDADWRLHSLLATVHAEAYSLRIVGRRRGDELFLTLSTPTGSVTQRLRDPAGRIWISGLSSWAAFHELRVGQRGRMWLLNPLALKPEPVSFHVKGRELVDGKATVVIETDYLGVTTTTWITPDGVVVKETSPMGWRLVQEPMEQALAIDAAAASAPLDLLSTVAVTVDRRIEQPDRLSSLTMLVEGVDPEAFRVDRRPWQEVVVPGTLEAYGLTPPTGPWCLVRLTRPASSTPDQPVAEAPRRYTMPSLFVQSDDAAIREQAKQIVGPITEPWPQAVALHHWVWRTLTKRLTIGLPSAKDVLATKVGDCHEHTVLFTALARSLAIPTRMVAGLVYYQDRFYYHAWPEVWIRGQARWLPLDPTLGEPVANATHVGLIEAENEELVALAQFVGRIRLRVLDMEVD